MRVVPAPSAEMQDRALAAAMKYVNEQGVTSVHNMGTWDDLDMFARARKRQTLTTRIYAAVPLDAVGAAARHRRANTYGGADGRGDDWLRIGGLKGFVDGSLGSHTAAFHEPFTDAPKDRGLLVNTPERPVRVDLRRRQGGTARHGARDRRPRESACCSTSTSASRSENGARDRRFRIEHAQHLRQRDIPRFAHSA